MRGTTLTRYSTPDGAQRVLALRPLDGPPGPGRLTDARSLAVLAALLDTRGALLVDSREAGGADERLVGAFAPGEGLLAVQALAADYVEHAADSRVPLARRVRAEDLEPPAANWERAA